VPQTRQERRKPPLEIPFQSVTPPAPQITEPNDQAKSFTNSQSAKVVLGSGLIDHSQKMTAAAMQIAEK